LGGVSAPPLLFLIHNEDIGDYYGKNI
jgi:hypothetical protein